jgi:molybdate transport system ATP-binding protein
MIAVDVKKKLHAAHGEMLLEVALQVPEGSFCSIYGDSGAGKTTLLRMIAGLLAPDDGVIQVGGACWFDRSRRINKAPQQRKIGFVFQDYALFPNMSIRENLEVVLPDRKQRHSIEEILELMDLSVLANRSPATLSGGQQQRVALARALVRQPQLLLLDEPLSALDHEMRLRLQDEIARIHRHFGLTTLLISHEPSEIYRLSDLVVQLEAGSIVRQGSPDAVFYHHEISGKIQIVGELLQLEQNDVVYIARIISGNKIYKVVLSREQAASLAVGDKVLLASKAFNPVVVKIN